MKVVRLPSIITQITKFFLPFIIAAIVILILYFFLNEDISIKLFVLMFAYFFPPLGKESIIPVGVYGGTLPIPFFDNQVAIPKIDPLIMALTIAFVDIIVALFLVWNYDLAKKIPLLGRFMVKVEGIGKNSSSKYSWIKPLRFIGIMLFVMVPFQGSGGLVGSILGRLIGMKPWNTFFAISSGSILGCLLLAYFAGAVLSVFVKNFLFGILIFIIIVIIAFMVLVYRRRINNSKNVGSS